MKIHLLVIVILAVVNGEAYASKNLVSSQQQLAFSNLESDFHITDLNKYDCKKINHTILSHVLSTGVFISGPELHDHYASTGCSIQGTVYINHHKRLFEFEYGGYFRFSDGRILACGEACCTKILSLLRLGSGCAERQLSTLFHIC